MSARLVFRSHGEESIIGTLQAHNMCIELVRYAKALPQDGPKRHHANLFYLPHLVQPMVQLLACILRRRHPTQI